ncbi:MAG: DoxX family protein [Puniceicoccaceae bacterium]
MATDSILKKRLFRIGVRVVVAIILAQSLFFKLTGTPESVSLFRQLGLEPLGRYAVGGLELILVVMLFVPKLVGWAALAITLLLLGALYFHATVLGFSGTMASLVLLAGIGLGGALMTLNWYWRDLLRRPRLKKR